MIVQQKRYWNLNIYLRTLFYFIFNWSVYTLISSTKSGPLPELERERNLSFDRKRVAHAIFKLKQPVRARKKTELLSAIVHHKLLRGSVQSPGKACLSRQSDCSDIGNWMGLCTKRNRSSLSGSGFIAHVLEQYILVWMRGHRSCCRR